MKHLVDAVVSRNVEIRPGIWSMWLHSPAVTREAEPGQFVHVRVGQSFSPLLRRPLSIGRVRGDQLELVWRVIGEGTRRMTEAREGDTINLLGPLGTPFVINQSVQHHVLVGGGLGLPPLVYLYEQLRSRGLEATLLLGVRQEDDIPLADGDPALQETVVITEVETTGRLTGLVTLPAADQLARLREDPGLDRVSFYACGPWGLVQALQRLLPHQELASAQVSLEQQMGCASGVCQGCAVRVDGGDSPYQLVCSDGPVFPLASVHPPTAV